MIPIIITIVLFFYFVMLLLLFYEKQIKLSIKKAYIILISIFVCLFLIIFFLIIFSGSFDYIFLLVYFFLPILLTLSKLVKPSNWFLLLLLPATYFTFKGLILFNSPNGSGVMSGVREFFLGLFYTFVFFPIVLFSLRSLRNNYFTSIYYFALASTALVVGVRQVYGIEGFLADDEGGGLFTLFIFFIYLLGFLKLKEL